MICHLPVLLVRLYINVRKTIVIPTESSGASLAVVKIITLGKKSFIQNV